MQRVVPKRIVEHQVEHDTAMPSVRVRDERLPLQELVDTASGDLAESERPKGRQHEAVQLATIEILRARREIRTYLHVLEPRRREFGDRALRRERNAEAGRRVALVELLPEPMLGLLRGRGCGSHLPHRSVAIAVPSLGTNRAAARATRADVAVRSDLEAAPAAHGVTLSTRSAA
ncbi:hypothetical protein MTO99_07530 [Agromyces larvae]|uniref:Uncharacterized protein n=1 Tax=Agromyces larvae TaxID=2929802 RepID=A0ABY4C2D2_9MICO|nr:hypothetical protein [Agromyces larvae]UOE45592.1 hypothetical protein MTO99_07530 [Agromyces larvae]